MADPPFSPWRKPSLEEAPAPSSPLRDIDIKGVAELYVALAKQTELHRGFSPREVDELELWECAQLIGVADSHNEEKHGVIDWVNDKMALFKARVDAERQGKRLRWSDLEE